MEEIHTVNFTVKSSWIPVNKEVKEAFFVEDYQEGNTPEDPSAFIDLQSCVQLARTPGHDEGLSVYVRLDGKEVIRKVAVICEAPIVEVYGMFEEYIQTIRGEKLEEVDGTTVYVNQLEGIRTNELLMKFLGLKGAEKMWLLGVRLSIAPGTMESRLDELLAGAALSEKAQKFRTMALVHAPPSKVPFISLQKSAASADAVAELRRYIDTSIAKMEQRVVYNIQQQVRELEERQNERLDSIIQLLTAQSMGRD